MILLKNRYISIILVSLLSLLFPFFLGAFLDTLFDPFTNIPLHSVLEASGAVMAFTVSMFIFLMYKSYMIFGHFNWTAVALTGMGIFDFFHAFMYPGELFVWFHSVAVFTGGLLFSLVWTKERSVTLNSYYSIPLSIILLSITISIVSLAFPTLVPQMIENGKFSDTAIWLNIIGGAGFIVAGINFLLRFYRYEELDEILFAGHTFLFGISGILFATSYIWEPSWWLWHFLRFFAYLIALYFTYELFSRKSDLLYEEKKRLGLELIEKQKQLLTKSRMEQMGEMISMIAHQWRQPLSTIAAVNMDLKLKIELEVFNFKDKESQEQCKDFLLDTSDNIASYVNNLSTTIDDFRNFYKPNRTYSQEPISKPLEQALKIFSNSLEVNSIKLVLDCQSKRTLSLYVNEMMQVILNIIKNAQDNFIEKGTSNAQITISSKDYDDMTTFVIHDNGGGIPSDIMEKIFDPYFTTKGELNGTGLGLYMSKTIVEEHHYGKLSAISENGGTSFCIELKK